MKEVVYASMKGFLSAGMMFLEGLLSLVVAASVLRLRRRTGKGRRGGSEGGGKK